MMKKELWLLLDSSGIGGIETHVLELCAGLRARYVNATIVLMKDHGDHPLKAAANKRGLPLRIISGGIPGLIKQFLITQPQLIHTHGYKAGIVARLISLLLEMRVVSSFHAGEPGNGKLALYQWLDYKLAGIAKCVAVSEAILEKLPDNSQLINNFIQVPKESSCEINKYFRKTIGFVGRLSSEKGPDTFLALAKAFPEFSFVMFGDGPEKADLIKAKTDNVSIRGSVSSMDDYWKEIDLLCITSRYEGLPLAAIEAMARKIPVCSYNVGELASLVSDRVNGYLVESNNIHEMELALKEWLSLSEKAKSNMAMEARTYIKSHYSDVSVVPQFLSLYEIGQHEKDACSQEFIT